MYELTGAALSSVVSGCCCTLLRLPEAESFERMAACYDRAGSPLDAGTSSEDGVRVPA